MAETMKVFVGNLAWSTTDEQLSAFMAPAGNIVSAEVQTHEDTGRSKGWGLVEYSTAAEAANAVATLNNMELEERTVHVRLDRSNIDTTSGFSVFVGNLPWSTTSEALAAVMAPFEPFDVHVKTNMAGRSRGFAVARFSTPEQAQAAIADLNGYDLEGRQIQVREDRDLGDQPPRERAPRRRNRGGGGARAGRRRRPDGPAQRALCGQPELGHGRHRPAGALPGRGRAAPGRGGAGLGHGPQQGLGAGHLRGGGGRAGGCGRAEPLGAGRPPDQRAHGPQVMRIAQGAGGWSAGRAAAQIGETVGSWLPPINSLGLGLKRAVWYLLFPVSQTGGVVLLL